MLINQVTPRIVTEVLLSDHKKGHGIDQISKILDAYAISSRALLDCSTLLIEIGEDFQRIDANCAERPKCSLLLLPAFAGELLCPRIPRCHGFDASNQVYE